MEDNKPWGRQETLYSDEHVQLDRIHVHSGGYSSIHLHESKDNYFWVVEGTLIVRTYSFNGHHLNLESNFELTPSVGSWLAQYNVLHQFQAERECLAYELYVDRNGSLRTDDIVRYSDNGRQ